MATLLSIQTGIVQTHTLPNGEPWTTGYIKTPVSGAVFAGKIRLEGDEQKHLKFHGGEHRALLGYYAGHYSRWQQETGRALPYGSFGENFVFDDLNEDNVCLGDIYQIGDTVRVQASQPRQPCDQIYKHLQIRGIKQRVDETKRTGWYMRVLTEGQVEAGMPVTLIERGDPHWTIRRAHEAMDLKRVDAENALRLADLPALSPGWQVSLRKYAGQSQPDKA
jgi:MOSC domain-containing protein YiiM